MRLFEKVKILDVVSWTTLITTYVHKGEEEHALEAFKRMRIVYKCLKGIKANQCTKQKRMKTLQK